ncbi:DUF5696 domain-containing protein [Paenibacillus sp. FSL K6-1217]|uniref:DUF5696 domain-containing protein n=1 Tax=Paenibacillus sp. FSL K6-1217 TaxID=2921466 RepID=UPI00324BF13F
MKKKLTIIAVVLMLSGAAVPPYVNLAESAPEAAAAVQSEVQSGQDTRTPKAPELSADMKAVLDNEYLTLYLNKATTEIAVKDKSSGALWYSNPQDREQDAVATGYNKSKLNVQVGLTYYDNKGNLMNYDNYTHSVQSSQFTIEQSGDSLNIVYTLGEVKSNIDGIPKYISEERFRTLIIGRLENDSDKREIEKRFRYDEPNKRYERRDTSFKGVGLKKVTSLFEQVGYDEAQTAIDKAAYGEEDDGAALVTLPLEYRLDGKQLRVSIPGDKVRYPDTMHIQTLSLLPFFGASGTKDEGYSLVPDGSGSLIHFNNNKLYASPYRTAMYGPDAALTQLGQVQKEETARLPVFGMKVQDRGFLAVIESGDAVAAVEADVSGRLNQYNNVFSSYTLGSLEEVTLTNGWRSSTVKQFQAGTFSGDITVAYSFLDKEEASYSGMAAYYREYLTEHTGMTRLDGTEGVPFYLELIGGIPKKKFFLGIPYSAYEPLTSFKEAKIILEQMQEKGIGDIQLRYTGWFNGGINHDYPKSVSVDSKLGGAKGLQALQSYTQDKGITLYPDASFLQSFPEAKGLGKSQASRLITGKLAHTYPYDISNLKQDVKQPSGYVVSPRVLPDMVDGFLKDYTELGVSGLSLRDFGSGLNSDFKAEDLVDRQRAEGIIKEQLERMNSSVPRLMIEGGNAYAAPFARHIVAAPMQSSGFNITDESIPFFQMVYHGYLQYTGTAWNMAEDQDAAFSLLKALETGSAPHYTWFYADPSKIKMTGFGSLYSADYRSWMDQAAKQYQELSRVLKRVQSQTISEHKKLAEGVYQTAYEAGTTIIVNYNQTPVSVGGVTIDGRNYRVGGERQP